MVCFLCGRTNSHYAYDCRTYKNEICAEVQCNKCGLFHDKSKCKHQTVMNYRGGHGQVIAN
jgi:hypothetical protein